MNPERLKEIAEPLEKLFRDYDFQLERTPSTQGTVRAAVYSRSDGLMACYVLEVLKDADNGTNSSESAVDLSGHLFKNRQIIPLIENTLAGAYMPAPKIVSRILEEESVDAKLYFHTNHISPKNGR